MYVTQTQTHTDTDRHTHRHRHTHTHTHTHTGMLLSHKKEWNNAICNNMDGPRDYHAKWSQTEEDKYYVTSLICGI